MLPKFYLVLDVDDTLVNTELAIADVIRQQFGYVCPANVYLDPTNTGGHHAQVIAEAKFMVDTPLEEGTAELFAMLPKLIKQNIIPVICTHRGYHDQGLAHTIAMLNRYEIREHFEHVFVLDYNTTPDKVAFLDQQFGAANYTLVDDRPRFDQGHPLPERIALVDRPWNQHIDAPTRITRVDVFAQRLLDATCWIENVNNHH